ncbi:hypothetical protein V6N12_006085 [Hibiscus sabdariffa]|uniref:Uncharacterized protein n=1 Tax=Hibiscus sabdariffa TaxID=183260 RepID=A0ABR2EWY2_9ROSI
MVHPCLEKSKTDEKEEETNINDETVEKSLQKAVSTDVNDRQDQLLASAEDKSIYTNVPNFDDPEGTAGIQGDGPNDHEKW